MYVMAMYKQQGVISKTMIYQYPEKLRIDSRFYFYVCDTAFVYHHGSPPPIFLLSYDLSLGAKIQVLKKNSSEIEGLSLSVRRAEKMENAEKPL